MKDLTMTENTHGELNDALRSALDAAAQEEMREQHLQTLRRAANSLQSSKVDLSTRSALDDALPTLIATFGAALIGAAADKKSLLRYAGALPGTIDVIGRARRNQDFSELVVPLIAAVAGAAAPALIK
jgi:anti-sigma factor RsiW